MLSLMFHQCLFYLPVEYHILAWRLNVGQEQNRTSACCYHFTRLWNQRNKFHYCSQAELAILIKANWERSMDKGEFLIRAIDLFLWNYQWWLEKIGRRERWQGRFLQNKSDAILLLMFLCNSNWHSNSFDRCDWFS